MVIPDPTGGSIRVSLLPLTDAELDNLVQKYLPERSDQLVVEQALARWGESRPCADDILSEHFGEEWDRVPGLAKIVFETAKARSWEPPEPRRKPGLPSPEELLQSVADLALELGHTPGYRDLKNKISVYAINQQFGSYPELLHVLDLEPNASGGSSSCHDLTEAFLETWG